MSIAWVIPMNVHAVAEYLGAVKLIQAPWLLGAC